MLIEFGQDRDRDDEDFGLAVRIVGQSELEKALLTHLQDGVCIGFVISCEVNTGKSPRMGRAEIRFPQCQGNSGKSKRR